MLSFPRRKFLTVLSFVLVALALVSSITTTNMLLAQEDSSGGSKVAHLPHHHSLGVVLKKGDPDRCFYITSNVAEDRMFFEYRSKTGKINFDVTIKQPGGQVVFQSLAGEYEETGGNKIFFVSKATGEYSICLGNPTETRVALTVNAAVASKKRATRKRDPVVRSVGVMKATIEALLEDQEFLRGRERAHRDTLETHNTQVILRFFLEVVVLLSMSVGQVFFLRRLFDKRRHREA